MKQIFRYFLLGLGAAAGLSACNKEGGAAPDATSLHVDFHVMTDLNVVKSAALSDENKVTAIDLFAFDAASGLLEVMQRDIPAKAPSDAGVAGEKKVGDVSLSFGKGGAKKILAIANTAANRVELPASLEAGVTTYAQMLESVVRLPEGNGAPSSPFVMTGYANDVQTGTGSVTGFALPQSGPVRHRQPDAGRRVRRIGRFEATTAERACARLPVQRWLQCIRS